MVNYKFKQLYYTKHIFLWLDVIPLSSPATYVGWSDHSQVDISWKPFPQLFSFLATPLGNLWSGQPAAPVALGSGVYPFVWASSLSWATTRSGIFPVTRRGHILLRGFLPCHTSTAIFVAAIVGWPWWSLFSISHPVSVSLLNLLFLFRSNSYFQPTWGKLSNHR